MIPIIGSLKQVRYFAVQTSSDFRQVPNQDDTTDTCFLREFLHSTTLLGYCSAPLVNLLIWNAMHGVKVSRTDTLDSLIRRDVTHRLSRLLDPPTKNENANPRHPIAITGNYSEDFQTHEKVGIVRIWITVSFFHCHYNWKLFRGFWDTSGGRYCLPQMWSANDVTHCADLKSNGHDKLMARNVLLYLYDLLQIGNPAIERSTSKPFNANSGINTSTKWIWN